MNATEKKHPADCVHDYNLALTKQANLDAEWQAYDNEPGLEREGEFQDKWESLNEEVERIQLQIAELPSRSLTDIDLQLAVIAALVTEEIEAGTLSGKAAEIISKAVQSAHQGVIAIAGRDL